MRKIFLLIIFAAEICILSMSCMQESQKHEAPPTFYYYPRKNVYYDIKKKNYLYSLDGAKTWTTLAGTFDTDAVSLGGKVPLYNDSTLVYADNARHLRQYGGSLLDIAGLNANPQATAEAAERKLIKKKPEIVQPASEEKPKKGIGKFLNKIFGKHHNK